MTNLPLISVKAAPGATVPNPHNGDIFSTDVFATVEWTHQLQRYVNAGDLIVEPVAAPAAAPVKVEKDGK